MDIKPPPKSKPKTMLKEHSGQSQQDKAGAPKPSDANTPKEDLSNTKKNSCLKWWIIGLVALVLAMALGILLIYQQALSSKDVSNKQKVRILIREGENSASIGDLLERRGIIKSSLAFQIYTQLTGSKHQLQAGAYAFSPADSVPRVTAYLKDGRTDTFNVTVYPGQSLKEIKKTLEKQGFTQGEVKNAFSKEYPNPLLGEKMMTGDELEGYVFPETYQMSGSDSLDSIIIRSMQELQGRIQESGLLSKLKQQKLTLSQAITLASIIQKEVANEQDEKQVAQIFLKRLRDGIRLDADSTFVFAAKQQGEAPTVDFDSKYNTRLHSGLPPGPIGNFNFAALEAVASPASGDYLYFVSGDDGTTHYAHSLKEHEKNTRKYCKANCNLF